MLKAGALTPVTAADGKATTECVGACVSSGMWLEGSVTPSDSAQGVWVELNGTACATNSKASCGFGFAIDRSGNFTLGEMDSAGASMPKPLVLDRAMKLAKGAPVSFKLLLRNAWSGLGMSEFYVNDVLALPFTLPAALTGSYAPTGGNVKISGVNRLSLPEASR